MAELFDIVDDHDNIIGTTDKKTAHVTGDRHRIAAVFVFNQAGELYVQEHKRDGKWDHSVGGHVKQGESYLEAAQREAQEELGITQPLTEIGTSLLGEEYLQERHMFGLYTCVADAAWEFIPNDEVDTIFPIAVVAIRDAMRTEPETKFTRGFRITLAAYLASNLSKPA